MIAKTISLATIMMTLFFVSTAGAQQDDYYLRKVMPKIKQLESRKAALNLKDNYQVRRYTTDTRLATEMFAKAEKKSPSYAKTAERLKAIQTYVKKINQPKPEPKLSVSKQTMQKKYGGQYGGGSVKMPSIVYGELKPERSEEILKYVATVKSIKDDLAKELPAMKKNPEIFKYQIRYSSYLEKKSTDDMKRLVQRLSQPMQGTNQRLKIGAEVDLSNKNHVVNRLGERTRNQIAKMTKLSEPLLKLATRIEADFGTNYGSVKLQQEFHKWNELYQAKVKLVEGGKLTELPKDINKPELAKIAREVIKKKKYGIKNVKKMIVNSDKRSKERITYEVSGNTVEKVIRKWDEFQVTTVEEIGGKLYLHFNTIAYFHRGASTTPTKKWIVSNRFKSSEISAANAGLKK